MSSHRSLRCQIFEELVPWKELLMVFIISWDLKSETIFIDYCIFLFNSALLKEWSCLKLKHFVRKEIL